MNFYYAESCGNTFLLCDSLQSDSLEKIDLELIYSSLMREKRDDALILFKRNVENRHLFAHYLVLGCDKQFGEFCGNGARACSAYLHSFYPECERFTLLSSQRTFPLKRLDAQTYGVTLPPPSRKWSQKFLSDKDHFQKEYPELTYIEAIEPHLSIQKEMGDQELFSLGRELNGRKDLFPSGINLNAWGWRGKQELHVKTYERGVQRLTLSCGTGSIACAAHAQLKGAISVQTPGGKLHIRWEEDGVELSGESRVIPQPLLLS